MTSRIAFALAFVAFVSTSTGCVGMGMTGMPVSGGYNTTNTVNQVPCGPAGSLVPVNNPNSFDQAIAADVVSCQQWFRLAIYNQCLARNAQLQQQYLSIQIGAKIADRIGNGRRGYSSTYIQQPRYEYCQPPQVIQLQRTNYHNNW